MSIEFGFSDGLVNTHYAPLAAILVHCQRKNMLEPLEKIVLGRKIRDFTTADKLEQLLCSILAGCDTLSEVNPKLGAEAALAQACGWSRFADQSSLSRLLDSVTLKQLGPLRQATTQIWRSCSRTIQHDWRGYLWLDYDFSGLPCSARAEASQKGYFSGKKTHPDAN